MDLLVIQGYMRQALGASAELAAIVGNRVYDLPPANPQFPYVVIGDAQGGDASAGCSEGWEVIAKIDAWSREVGFPEVKEITRHCCNALHERHPSIAGIKVGVFELRGVRVLRDPDGVTSHSVIEFRTIYGPT